MNKSGSIHLSYEERSVIEKLSNRDYSIRKIASILKRSPNTISKEIERNKVKGEYLAKKAEQKAYQRRYWSKYQSFGALEYEAFIRCCLEKRWSPETISGYLKRFGNQISSKAIYKYIHSRCLERYLWKRSGSKQKRTEYLSDSRKFIEDRPVLEGLGHYEADFIVCSQNNHCLFVFVEKQSKATFIYHLQDRKKKTLFSVFDDLISKVVIQIITTDNDIAFSCWRELEKRFGFDIFFTHPYRSWEKPLVEQTNKLIRQFVPKGTNLREITKKKLGEIDMFLNHKPRQCLNFLTAYEKYQLLQK